MEPIAQTTQQRWMTREEILKAATLREMSKNTATPTFMSTCCTVKHISRTHLPHCLFVIIVSQPAIG